MTHRLNRREFLGRSAVAATTLAVGYHTSSLAAESKSPAEKLHIASVGCQGRAAANIGGTSSENFVALCDVDANSLGKMAARYPGARTYRDFRVMLEKEAEKIDAVLVGTPDHTHAPAAAMALRLKKHVYCEKPLTHTVQEARTLSELTKQNKLVTQMGTQIHAGTNYRRVVELVQSGAIGPIKEAHVWVNVNHSGARFTTGTPAPKHVDWDLWLGPAAARPYSAGVHPFNWRRFWDYGTGGLGDLGCHYMDLVHWALDLRNPTSLSAQGPTVDRVSTPPWVIVDYQYPARGKLPAVKLTWYDGGRRPKLLSTLEDKSGKPINWGSAQLFVGQSGMILSNYGQHVLLREGKVTDFKRPEPTIPNSIGHHREWIQAIKTGGTTTCNFDYAGALTESVMLGIVAYRSGKRIEWDAKNLKVTNAPEAQSLIHKEYRKGWTL
jgi:predicted dehydrogenase